MFERILVALDGSARAEAVLGQVRKLLRRQDAEVLLVRAVHEPLSLAKMDTGRLLAEHRAEAEEYVHGLAIQLRSQGARARARVVAGPAAEALLETARREKATMIAMSTHGRSGVARWVLGSVAEKVVRGSDVPVLLLRSFREEIEIPALETEFRRILVTVDGSPESREALEPALDFARVFGSEVLVLHVREPARVAVYAGVFPEPVPVPAPPVESGAGDEAALKAAERFRSAGLAARPIVLEGDAATEILAASFARGVDLVAMATHGRTGLSRWMLGSVTEKVLHGATVPMLIVRSKPEGAAP